MKRRETKLVFGRRDVTLSENFVSHVFSSILRHVVGTLRFSSYFGKIINLHMRFSTSTFIPHRFSSKINELRHICLMIYS